MSDSLRDELYSFPTGAKRSGTMPRYDLIPKIVLDRLARRFTGSVTADGSPDGGALKYGEGNWQRGLPTSDVLNHAFGHLANYASEFATALFKYNGDMAAVVKHMREHSASDDDLAGAMWGLCVLMWQEENAVMIHDDRFKL